MLVLITNKHGHLFIGGDRYIYNADGSLYKDGMVPRTFYRKDSTSEQAALDLRFIGDVTLGNWEHALLMGAQYQDVTTDSDGYYAWAVGFDPVTRGPDALFGDAYWLNIFDPKYGNTPPDALLNSLYTDNPESNSKDLGIYLTDQISYNNWIVTLGLRYDETESKTLNAKQKDDAFSFSGGVLYAFDSGFSPYASFAESFDPVVGSNNNPTNPQPLKPMLGEQWELGVKYQPSIIPALVTLAYFDIEQSNLPDPQTNPGEGWKQQSGITTVKGFEVKAIGAIGDFQYEINASRLDTKSPEGFQLASVPKKQASTWLTYRPSEILSGLKTGLGVRYVGASYGGADSIKTPSHTLYDLMFGYTLEHWDFSVNVQNLFNKEYQATCLYRGDCFPGNERTVIGRVRYAF